MVKWNSCESDHLNSNRNLTYLYIANLDTAYSSRYRTATARAKVLIQRCNTTKRNQSAMKSAAVVLMVAILVPAFSYPDPLLALAEYELGQRDDNGYVSIKDLGELLSGMCGQLSVFKQTLAGSLTAGYGQQILDTPLPLPNLGKLDFLGIIKLVTEGLGQALDISAKTIGANQVPSSTDATTSDNGATTAAPGFLLTVGNIVEMAEYLCKVVNLVAAVLNNKLFDALHINRITIPLRDPRHPLPDLNWYDKLDILNLQALGKGIYNTGAAVVNGIACWFGCAAPATTEAPAVPEELKKPEKPSVFDDLSSFYNFKRK